MKMKVVSYNLRYMPNTEIDGINNFTHRIGRIFEKIQSVSWRNWQRASGC